ncbi:mechanosensitive ion channel family protein [Synechococcus sp. CBW1108]|uniref:mechanosensitive ion channel family protein n=1 Tax=Synechococcus sp. CBW1108 TaxID=1353147 RepID=UPI0018CDE067|nr:mechanosensitive ion channel domain-containing protein [Synechococcus sp. CBW1108]QPN70688.1 mechanosensitive ion channel [Synechococcus sp. CBW1108]
MPTAGLPFALQIPLVGALLALFAWLMLDRLGRRCPMGSLGRALLLSGRLSIATAILISGIGWWLAGQAEGRELRNLLLTVGVVWTLLRWRSELKQRAEHYGAQLLPHLSSKDQLFLFDVLDKLLSTAAVLVVLLMGLDLLGVSAGVLITAGGFGAAALAFGARTIVENGLSGLSLYINRPFTLGDTINLPGPQLLGTVEAVGWFYTELRDPDRQRIYIPNGLFTSQAVQNVAQIDNRRIWIEFGLSYADRDRIDTITTSLQEQLEHLAGVDPAKDRLVHFVDYGESSLNLRLLCFAASGTIQDAWALRQRVLLLIGAVVEQAGASMPFPTRTVIAERLAISAPDAGDRP